MVSDLGRGYQSLGEKDVPLILGTENAECTGHRDICLNFQDEEEADKVNPVSVLKSALTV